MIPKTCPECLGSGMDPDRKPCPRCGGLGDVYGIRAPEITAQAPNRKAAV